MSFSYANPGSGPSAGGIGWFDFSNLVINPGQTVTGLTGTLNDGSIVTFDLSLSNISGAPRNFTAVTAPTWGGAFFGTAGYTGILGNVALYSQLVFAPSSNTLLLNNIVVKDSLGNPVTNYTTVVADAESTGLGEPWDWITNGGGWKLLTTLGNSSSPTLTGIGTQNVSIVGNAPVNQNAYVLTTQSPTQLTLNSAALNNGGGRQAVAIGFAVTKVTVEKNIGGRIDSSDQFVLNIAGTPNSQVTTSGAAVGIQSQVASVFGIPGNAYTINEAMAPSSASPLTAYTQTVSAINLTPSGSIPPTGSLPINFTPALGDDVVYTILNSAPEIFTKSVDKTNAKPGDVLTYTVTGINPNNYAIPGVVFTDPTPAGTTYIGNLIVSVPYTGTTPATGLTVTMPPNSTVTASWQVQVNATAPVNNPIVNIASAVVPGGTSGSTNPVSTQINYADLTSNGNFTKSVDKAYAQFGDILTYTLSVHNSGNVAANNVVITDVIPTGTTYVAGSVSANVPFTGTPASTIALTNPIPAGGTATITFQVQLANSAPVTNPIPNTGAVNYAYTVDPTKPNGVTGSGASNKVTTTVATATLKTTKTADKTISYVGDIITYSLAIQNTGNASADNVVITDPIPNGTSLVPGSLVVSAPYSGSLATAITLTNAVVAGQTVTVSYQVKVDATPLPNPIPNMADIAYDYTVDPSNVDGVSVDSKSNTVSTVIFVNNYSQQINDLIESVALEEAALGAIMQAEGAKIQKFVAMPDVTPDMLLCVNKSVTDMTNSISLLESILNQKLNVVDCQINGTGTGC